MMSWYAATPDPLVSGVYMLQPRSARLTRVNLAAHRNIASYMFAHARVELRIAETVLREAAISGPRRVFQDRRRWNDDPRSGTGGHRDQHVPVS